MPLSASVQQKSCDVHFVIALKAQCWASCEDWN